MEMLEQTRDAVPLKPISGWSVGDESFSFSLLYLHQFCVVMSEYLSVFHHSIVINAIC